MQEFSLIKNYFHADVQQPATVNLGIGDDAAILTIPDNHQLVVTTDTLVEGVHFFPDVSPQDLAYKALAVNLSDLAAMGATPAWVSLALTLPKSNSVWLEAFSNTFLRVCKEYDMTLIGGDTTSGPLTISITAHGFVPTGKALVRSGANVGDGIYVTGYIGEARAGLAQLRESAKATGELVERLLRPTPRINVGLALRKLATSCLDLSDGLVGDIKHIMSASQVGARIDLESLPISQPLCAYAGCMDDAYEFALAGGDDYELCFTMDDSLFSQLKEAMTDQSITLTRIGVITKDSGLTLIKNGSEYHLESTSYEHRF